MFQYANPGGGNNTTYAYKVIYDMNYYFSVNYECTTTTKMIPAFVVEHILAGYPIYGSFSPGHAVVIRGVNGNTNTFSVMNPTSGNYEAGSIASDYTWSFISATTGNLFTLRCYGHYKFLNPSV